MRNLIEITERLKKDNFVILKVIPCGFHGIYKKGRFKGWTVSFTWCEGWEHASIDGKTRVPYWREMCEFKELFFDDEETVIQYHPPKSEYVNIAPYCLHLWKPIYADIIRPRPELLM